MIMTGNTRLIIFDYILARPKRCGHCGKAHHVVEYAALCSKKNIWFDCECMSTLMILGTHYEKQRNKY